MIRYSYPIHLLLKPALRVLFGIPSSISHDAALLLRGATPAPRVLNAENIPSVSSFILTFNHYDRPGLAAWWTISPVICAVAGRRAVGQRDIHMAMAREWWYPPGFGRVFKQPLTHWFFGQIEKAYGSIRLPPVLGDKQFQGEGAMPIRRAISLTRGDHPQLVGLAPEGRTGENLSLCKPPPGAGLFLLMLTHNTLPILPAGICESDDNRLTVRFGVPFSLCVPRGGTRQERDNISAKHVMLQIGKLLPERMWGIYREELSDEQDSPTGLLG
jgi:1-acyl-sn-glycerol-3-phosphate acyltransferase